MEDSFKLGDIVLSDAGRDKDRCFVVVDISDEFVFICDGDLRKSDKPKKKKIKHIRKTEGFSAYIAEKLLEDGKVTNAELRRAVSEFAGTPADEIS